ncbi:MAG TPA: alpha/beta fold hydrolase [Burkholderiales bacterium]|nr:alpha/beta fold hydrolase [Burkholderiales bacterium]
MSEAAAKPRSSDPRVAAAIAHWAPRFVSNGVLLADFEEVTAGIARWEAWCAAWCERGKVHEALGREALKQGYKLSAGEHLVRAAMYYHFAKFVFVHDPKQMRDAHLQAVACYRDALPHMRPPGERVAIPFEGRTMYGVLRKPAGSSGRLPILVMAPGLDSTKEELHAYEEPFLARGIAILAIDGPGQGEAEYDIPIRGDYERAAKAACDWIEKRDDLDASRIAMWGVSLGGYYAPRAAAYEKRIRACIGISGPFEWKEIWSALPLLTREAFRVRSHCHSEAEAIANAATLSMKDAAPKIGCPIFIVTGREDRLVPASHAERLARSVSGPVELLIVEDGGHNANNRPYRYRSLTADWLAGRLGLPRI